MLNGSRVQRERERVERVESREKGDFSIWPSPLGLNLLGLESFAPQDATPCAAPQAAKWLVVTGDGQLMAVVFVFGSGAKIMQHFQESQKHCQIVLQVFFQHKPNNMNHTQYVRRPHVEKILRR